MINTNTVGIIYVSPMVEKERDWSRSLFLSWFIHLVYSEMDLYVE